MKASFYALGPVPRAGPRAPPRVRAKRPVEVSEPVAGISIGLLVWAALALLPHSAPYNATLLLNLTLLSWNAVTWVAAGLMSVAMVGLLATSFLGHARVLKPEVLVLALVALLLTTTTYVYVSLLDLNGAQGWPNGMLRLAWRHCDGTPYEACLIAPGLQIDDRTPAERTSEAVSFFSASLYGAPLDTTAVTATDGSIDVVFGDTGRAECAVRVVVPAGAGPVLLSLGGEGAAGLAARHGLALVSSPGAPPSACGATGRIAVVAAATNAVAAALLTAGRASVALYGCSIAGKMASYASATFDRDYGRAYDHVFVDSGGSMGLASARHVGRGGETFHALQDRWPGWLAANASASRHPRDWPLGVDVVDLILESCLAGTVYHTTTSADDLWNAPSALQKTVNDAALAGCVIRRTESQGSKHCDLFA